jgi:hypothetical protein
MLDDRIVIKNIIIFLDIQVMIYGLKLFKLFYKKVLTFDLSYDIIITETNKRTT